MPKVTSVLFNVSSSWLVPVNFSIQYYVQVIYVDLLFLCFVVVVFWNCGEFLRFFYPWASYQIRKIAGCACAGNAGNVFPRRRFQRKPLVSDPGMHHGTCVMHVPWCMSGSLTCGDGESVPGIPGACAPAILRIWQEAHVLQGSKVITSLWDPVDMRRQAYIIMLGADVLVPNRPKLSFMVKAMLLILNLTVQIMVTLFCYNNIIIISRYDSLFETDMI